MAEDEIELRAEVDFDIPVSTVQLVLDSASKIESARDWVVCIDSADGSPRLQESGHNWYFSRSLDEVYLYLEADAQRRVTLRTLELKRPIRRAAVSIRPWSPPARGGERQLPKLQLLAQGQQGPGKSPLSVYTESRFEERA